MDKRAQKEMTAWAEGVVCKNCQRIHFITGNDIDNSPVRDYGESKMQVWCQNDGTWPEYDYDKDIIYKQIDKPATAIDAQLLMRIVEIENRLTKLETKTLELPEKDGIKQLKDDFAGFLADAMKASGKGATYG